MAETKPRPGGLSAEQYDILSDILYGGMGGVVPPQAGEQLAGQLGIIRPMPSPERGPEMVPIPQQIQSVIPAAYLQSPQMRNVISQGVQQSGVRFPEEPPRPAAPRPFQGIMGLNPALLNLLPYQFRQYF